MSTPNKEESERWFKYKGPGIIAGLPINPSDFETYFHSLTMIKFFGFSDKDVQSWLNTGLFIEVTESQVKAAMEAEELKRKSRQIKIIESTDGETSKVVVENPINSKESGESK